MAHQRKVSYMLARSYEDLEKRLQAQLREMDMPHNGPAFKPQSDRSEGTVDSKADRLSFSLNSILVVMDEQEEETRIAGQEE